MKVTVYTQVYNASAYLEKCIESVVKQTYQTFDYILIDNGSTDNSREIMQRYAELYPNIKLVLYDKNELSPRWLYHARHNCKDCYLTKLDPDDWWEENYLEQLVTIAENTNSDIIITGTKSFFEQEQRSQVLRQLPKPLFLSLNEFASNYPSLWIFPSTTWASLSRTEIYREVDLESILSQKLVYGTDTLVMLDFLKRCRTIYIDNSALYNYRIHSQSISFQYKLGRFKSNLACIDHITAFLSYFQALDQSKKEWLYSVYFNSVIETLRIALQNPSISISQKFSGFIEIAQHPFTKEAVQTASKERDMFLKLCRDFTVHAIKQNRCLELDSLFAVIAPKCNPAYTYITDVIMKDERCLKAFCEDNPKLLAELLLELLSSKKLHNTESIGSAISVLCPQHPFQKIQDTSFYLKYSDICFPILEGEYLWALEYMTDFLLSKQPVFKKETFLNLYLDLAALTQQVSAYLFGKLKLAQYYFNQQKVEQAKKIVVELEQMGMQDNDELISLKNKLSASSV